MVQFVETDGIRIYQILNTVGILFNMLISIDVQTDEYEKIIDL
jgi:hypothetical protein